MVLSMVGWIEEPVEVIPVEVIPVEIIDLCGWRYLGWWKRLGWCRAMKLAKEKMGTN